MDKYNIGYETCNDLYNGDTVDSVMLCVNMPGGGEDNCQCDSGDPIFKDWFDVTICVLSSSHTMSCGAD